MRACAPSFRSVSRCSAAAWPSAFSSSGVPSRPIWRGRATCTGRHTSARTPVGAATRTATRAGTEIPDPAGAAAAGRPDACTNCHVARTAAWAEAAARRFWGESRFPAEAAAPPGSAPLEALFGGAPVARAVAADALGRAPSDATGRARRVGALLDVMAEDRYPAVRHLAWRGLRRLLAPDALPGGGVAADYDPSGDAAGRRRAVAGLRTALGGAAVAPAPALVALRRGAADHDLEIGE